MACIIVQELHFRYVDLVHQPAEATHLNSRLKSFDIIVIAAEHITFSAWFDLTTPIKSNEYWNIFACQILRFFVNHEIINDKYCPFYSVIWVWIAIIFFCFQQFFNCKSIWTVKIYILTLQQNSLNELKLCGLFYIRYFYVHLYTKSTELSPELEIFDRVSKKNTAVIVFSLHVHFTINLAHSWNIADSVDRHNVWSYEDEIDFLIDLHLNEAGFGKSKLQHRFCTNAFYPWQYSVGIVIPNRSQCKILMRFFPNTYFKLIN